MRKEIYLLDQSGYQVKIFSQRRTILRAGQQLKQPNTPAVEQHSKVALCPSIPQRFITMTSACIAAIFARL